MQNTKTVKRTSFDRKAIIVAGYYRSGTSALSGALSNLGVHVPGDAEGNEHNPKGFFESTKLIEFDIGVLNLLGSVWSDLQDLPEGWIERPDIQYHRNRLGDILKSIYQDAPLIAVKHPHICRLFPLYVQALEDIGYDIRVLHTHRSPYAIATSQMRKNNLSRAHALALWASYITSAEFQARSYRRAWVHYKDLLDDPDQAVRQGLQSIGIGQPEEQKVSFVTKALNRSMEAARDKLYPPLQDLIADIEATILTNPCDDGRWDDLRARAGLLAAFVAELGSTGNRASPGVGGQTAMPFVQQQTGGLTLGAATHPLRPAERGDVAEASRVAGLLETLRKEGAMKSVTILVTAPEGTTRSSLDRTLSSLREGWHSPEMVLVCLSNPGFQVNDLRVSGTEIAPSNDAMNERVFDLVSKARTDYVALIAAGDRIEIDAMARFALASAETGADMVYSDEIAASQNGPWIRAKPRMTFSRLIESCFVGDWVWYRTATLREFGGFAHHDYPGAEEYHFQMRLVARHGHVHHVAEPLFVRAEDTSRDGLPIETSLTSAERAINDTLRQHGIPIQATRAELPGLFVPEFGSSDTRTAVVAGLRCEQATPDVVQVMVARILPTLSERDVLVFIRPHGETTEAMDIYLDRIETEIVSAYPNIRMIQSAAKLGGTLARLQAVRPDAHVALVDCLCAPSQDDIVMKMGAIIDATPDCGVLSPRVFHRDREGATHFHGPLLFGAGERVGAGSPADSPGPGGWLATTQPVDAVDGPVVMIRAGVIPDQTSAGWADLCAMLPETAEPFWTPHFQVEIPAPQGEDATLAVARSLPYRGQNHHPAMTVCGSPLLLEGRGGLIRQAGAVVITGSGLADDGRILSASRYGRNQGFTASYAQDVVDVFSILRARSQGRLWCRLNPQYNLVHPGSDRIVESDINFWSTLPDVSLRDVVLAARATRVTSAGLGARLRGMGARHVTVWEPGLTESVWSAFLPRYATARPVAIWVAQPGLDVPWLDQLIEGTQDKVAWVVLGAGDRPLPGHVARNDVPVFEEGWARMFQETGASVLVRPTLDASWADDWLVLAGIVGGCRVLAGSEAAIREKLQVSRCLPSGQPTRWIKAVLDLAETPPDPNTRKSLFDLESVWLSRSGIEALLAAPPGTKKGEGAVRDAA